MATDLHVVLLMKAGRYVEDTYSATRDRAAGAADTVRDAASRGAQTVTGGRQDHDSAGRTGAAYRDATGQIEILDHSGLSLPEFYLCLTCFGTRYGRKVRGRLSLDN